MSIYNYVYIYNTYSYLYVCLFICLLIQLSIYSSVGLSVYSFTCASQCESAELMLACMYSLVAICKRNSSCGCEYPRQHKNLAITSPLF